MEFNPTRMLFISSARLLAVVRDLRAIDNSQSTAPMTIMKSKIETISSIKVKPR